MSRLTDAAITALIDSCDKLQERTVPAHGFMHSSCRCFNACMRAFDAKGLAPVALTFRVCFAEPVSQVGFARIHSDGTMQRWTGDDPHDA